MDAGAATPGSARRAAELLWVLSAAGEIGVGLLVATLPALAMGFLLGAPLDGTGVVVARMMGIAAASLGFAWWPDRNRLDLRRLREVAPAFVGYNPGVGLVFVARSFAMAQALSLSALVAAVHLLAASAFAIIASRTRATGDRASHALAADSPGRDRPKGSPK